jgi:hypothetical protein
MITKFIPPQNLPKIDVDNSIVLLSKTVKIDNPYWRKCAYCGEYFFCYHQGQKYCLIKYGKQNHCRREQEKLVKSKKIAVPILKIEDNNNKKIEWNYRILKYLLKDKSRIEIDIRILKNYNYTDEAFTLCITNENEKYYIVNDICIKGIRNNEVLIFKKQ